MLALVAGCGRFSFDGVTDAGTDVTSAAFQIVDVTPGWTTIAGGAIEITVTGDLGPAIEVLVDGQPCTGLVVARALSCTAPAHVAGTVVLTVSDGIGTDSEPFFYVNQGAVQIGSPVDDRTSGVAIDPDGYVYISGTTGGDLDGPSRGAFDAVLIKLDPAGAVVWIRQLGGPLVDFSRDVAVDGDRGVRLVGYTANALGTGGLRGGNDAFVASYLPDGTLEWVTQIGTAANEQAFDLGIDAAGAAIVALETGGVLSGPGAGGVDFALARVSSVGAVEWITQGGTSGDEDGHSVAVAADGTSYLVGSTNGILAGANAGGDDVFVGRFNPGGVQQWLRQRGGAGNDFATDAQLDDNGELWIAGYTSGSIDGGAFGGATDIFAMRYATDGTWQMTSQFGGAGNEITFGIAPTPTGAVIACTTNVAFDGQTHNGGDDLCAVALARDGTREWTRIFGSPLLDQASSCARDTSLTGFIYISIITGGSLDGMPNRGSNDIAVGKLDLSGAIR